MAKVYPLTPVQVQQSQEQPVQPSIGPLAPPPVNQSNEQRVFTFAAMTASSSPSGGMIPTPDVKTLADSEKKGGVMIFSHSRESTKNNKLLEKVDKFRYELMELEKFLNLDLSSDGKNENAKKIKELKKIIGEDLSSLKKQLNTIHDLERVNSLDDVINSKFISFENMRVEQLVEYMRLRKQLAELKSINRKFAADTDPSKPTIMKEILAISQLTLADHKEINDALNSSINCGNQLVLDLIKIVQETTKIINEKQSMVGIAKASPAFAMSQHKLNNAHHRRANSKAHYLLVESEQGGMQVYQNKVAEIKAKYKPCCCTVM